MRAKEKGNGEYTQEETIAKQTKWGDIGIVARAPQTSGCECSIGACRGKMATSGKYITVEGRAAQNTTSDRTGKI